jgi:hypothetical protein
VLQSFENSKVETAPFTAVFFGCCCAEEPGQELRSELIVPKTHCKGTVDVEPVIVKDPTLN